MANFNPFASVAKPAADPAPPPAQQLADSRSLSEFEKIALGQPLSIQLQDELKRTIAVRNLPTSTTAATLNRCLAGVPGGIRNLALFPEPPNHRAALIEFATPNGPNAHEQLARLGQDISPFILVTVPKVTLTQVNAIRSSGPAQQSAPSQPLSLSGSISSFFAPLVNFGANNNAAPRPAASSPIDAVPQPAAAAAPAPQPGPAAAPAYPDLRGRVAELEGEVQRLTKMLAEAEDHNQTLTMLLEESSPQLAANFRKSSANNAAAAAQAVAAAAAKPPPAAPVVPAAAAVVARPPPAPIVVPAAAGGKSPAAPGKRPPGQPRRLELSAGELESRRLMLSMKTFDQWRRWAHRKGLQRKGDQLTQKLLKEEAAAKQRENENKRYNCPICFSEITVSELYLVDDCDHRFCRDCLKGYLDTKINDGQTLEITCPVPKCPSRMNDREVKNLVDAKVYEKFEKFRLEKGLSLMDDVRFCPKPGCGLAMIGDPDSPMMVCQKCRYASCFNCKEEWHADSTCEQYQKWKVDNKSADSKYQEWVSRNAKQCPKCKSPIEKNGGCNHMTCGKCRYQFCWLCMKLYTSGHFGNMPWSCKQFT